MINCNDGSRRDPYLRCDINYWNTDDLPTTSIGPVGVSEKEKYRIIKRAGFQAVQDGDPHCCQEVGLKFTGQHRVNQIGDLDQVIHDWVDNGYDCASIHLGWGIESDDAVNRLVDYVLDTSESHHFPIYLETHRATVTQDMWRTVEIVKRFPEIRFNGDFSHWYTGLEMVNGDLEEKLNFIQPVIDRVRFMHGRIGNPGAIQVDVGDGRNQSYVDHFKEIWTRCFVAFLKSAKQGDFLSFTTELLPSQYFYARLVTDEHGKLVEEGDRWQQALLLCDIAEECLVSARRALNLTEVEK